MKILVPITLASVVLIAACTGSPQDPVDGKTTPATSSVHEYQCESGETIAATYPSTDAATVNYKGASHAMTIAISGSGARYAGGELEWWTKGTGPGSEGTLFHHNVDGTSGDIIEHCTAR